MSELRTKRYLSIQESADFWGVSPLTIRRRIADGTVPAARIGRTIRIKATDLESAGRPIREVRR